MAPEDEAVRSGPEQASPGGMDVVRILPADQAPGAEALSGQRSCCPAREASLRRVIQRYVRDAATVRRRVPGRSRSRSCAAWTRCATPWRCAAGCSRSPATPASSHTSAARITTPPGGGGGPGRAPRHGRAPGAIPATTCSRASRVRRRWPLRSTALPESQRGDHPPARRGGPRPPRHRRTAGHLAPGGRGAPVPRPRPPSRPSSTASSEASCDQRPRLRGRGGLPAPGGRRGAHARGRPSVVRASRELPGLPGEPGAA